MMASSDYPDWMTAEHKTGMTIVLAAEFDGGAVIGTNSRTTTGVDIANHVTVKLTPVTNLSGSAAAIEAIADLGENKLNILRIELEEPLLVKTVANVFHDICYTNRDGLTVDVICAGWDKRQGGQVFSIPSGGMCERQSFAIAGSGSAKIYGHCDFTFKRNMTKEECISFVSNAVAIGMTCGRSPGGSIHLAAIDETGIEKRVIQGYHPISEQEKMVEVMDEEGNYVKCPREVIHFDTGNRLGTAISAKLVKDTIDQTNKRCYTEEARDGFGKTISMLKIKIHLKIDERKFSLVAHCGITPKGIDLLIGMDIIEQLLPEGFTLGK